jgi:serine/threonine protein kinase
MNLRDQSHDGELDDSSTVFHPSSAQLRADRSDDTATVFHPFPQTTADGSDDGATAFHSGQSAQSVAAADAETNYRATANERDQPVRRETSRSRTSTVPAVGHLVLDGRFRLVEELKGGRQALAFKARDEVSGSRVFIKISTTIDYSDKGFARQIALRSHILNLDHRHLLRCLGMELSDGRLVEVYEYLEGNPLSDWLLSKKALERDELRSLILQLSHGINALHVEGGLVHRDIKPDNILVLPRAEPFLLKIVDYGTACRIAAGGWTPVEGTRYYSPPECLMRSSANDDVLRSWDWWSLGRVVQRVVDGLDMKERINQLSGLYAESGEHLLDEILLEKAVNKYRMKAGMVELSGKTAGAAPWVPLLRGLLTSSRSDRWGFAQVEGFMRGKPVEDKYDESASDLRGFVFNDHYWELTDLALHLINESAKLTTDFLLAGKDSTGRKDIWEQAKELARGGAFARYIEDKKKDVTLKEDLNPLLKLPQKDLSTALILLRVADAKQPPVVKATVVDRQLALDLARRTDPNAHEMFKIILSASYLTLHRSLHPDSAAGLESVVREIAHFRKLLVELDVRSTNAASRFSDQSLLLSLASEAAGAIKALDQFKVKLGRTDNTKLQAVFAKTTAALSSMERAALLLALAEPATNKFVSYDTIIADLRRRAEGLRVAAGLSEAAALLSNQTVFVFGNVWARMLAFLFAEGLVVSFIPTALRSQFLVTLPFWGFCVVLAAAFGFSKLLVPFALKADIRALDPEAGSTTQWQPKLLTERAGRWLKAPASNASQLLRELDSINETLRTIPSADSARLKVARPSFPRIRLAKLVQISICIIFLIITAFTGFVLKSEADEQKRFFALTHPKPFAVQNGREMYRASDLAPVSHGTEKFFFIYKVLHLEGNNIVIVGDLDRARIAAGTTNLVVQGNARSSEITLDNGSVTVGSVSQGTGITIKRDGTVTMKDVSHSTIQAKHIVVHSSDASALICETARVSGTVSPTDIRKHPWRNIP